MIIGKEEGFVHAEGSVGCSPLGAAMIHRANWQRHRWDLRRIGGWEERTSRAEQRERMLYNLFLDVKRLTCSQSLNRSLSSEKQRPPEDVRIGAAEMGCGGYGSVTLGVRGLESS